VALENLSICHCVIVCLPYFRGLRNFLSLVLFDMVFEADMFKEFIACCPLLEILNLTCCCIHDPLVISMPNVKRLSVDASFGL